MSFSVTKRSQEGKMVKWASFILVLGWVFINAGPLLAHPWLVGFSGAPGTYGVCMNPCHNSYPGGTINVQWFPARYQPGRTYRLTVGYIAADSVENFNSSVRVGWGAANAGLITADFGTETYSCSVETNGVHALARFDTCNFLWTAPPAGADTVRLYLSGFQGIEVEWGRTTQLILVSAEEISGAEEQEALSPKGNAFGLRSVGAYPVRGTVTLAYRAEGSDPAELRIYDLRGRLVRAYVLSGRGGLLRWDGRDVSGLPLPEGIYFFRLEQGPHSVTCKVLLIR
jgi:hypothetical protein